MGRRRLVAELPRTSLHEDEEGVGAELAAQRLNLRVRESRVVHLEVIEVETRRAERLDVLATNGHESSRMF